MSVNRKRAESILKKQAEQRELQIRAQTLKEQGYSETDIAKTLGVSEGTVKNYISKGEGK